MAVAVAAMQWERMMAMARRGIGERSNRKSQYYHLRAAADGLTCLNCMWEKWN
jgi:hypothetical protein